MKRLRPGTWKRLEIGLAICLALSVYLTAFDPGWKPAWSWTSSASFDVATSILALWKTDPSGTLREVAVMLSRSILALAPAAVLLFLIPAYRLVWLPVPLLLLPAIGIFSLISETGLWWWAGLTFLSILSTIVLVRRGPGIVVLVPVLYIVLPAMIHRGAPYLTDPRDLQAQCGENDGIRPSNLSVDNLGPGYYSVLPIDSDRMLLFHRRFGNRQPEEVRSRWVHREEGKLRLGAPVSVDGSHFHGCTLVESAWVVSDGVLTRIPFGTLDAGSPSSRTIYPQSQDWDSTETTCDASRRTVYLGEASQGGLWAYSLDGSTHRWQLDVEAVFPRIRPDGKIVLTSAHELMTFDPETGEITDRTTAALVSLGMDYCPKDDAVVVGDLAGRIRFFNRSPSGYRFDWGLDETAPRRVAFSPGCRFVAVTSHEGPSVSIIDRNARAFIRRFQVGPALREVTFVGERKVVTADACTVSLLEF